MRYHVPRYLNEQMRFIGLQSDEFAMVILSFYMCAIFRFNPLVVVLAVGLVAGFIYLNRRFPRGFVKHLAYFGGFYRFKHYPDFFATRFIE